MNSPFPGMNPYLENPVFWSEDKEHKEDKEEIFPSRPPVSLSPSP